MINLLIPHLFLEVEKLLLENATIPRRCQVQLEESLTRNIIKIISLKLFMDDFNDPLIVTYVCRYFFLAHLMIENTPMKDLQAWPPLKKTCISGISLLEILKI